MGSKTPVSILQEMMTRMGTAPKYDLIFDGSGTHTAEFRYKVYANNVSAIGSGRSKKEAKHEAARVALERLSLSQIEDSQPQEEPVEIVTPYKDKIQENAIGELHDMCATNDIPMPEYELVEEKGAPHEKIFTFVCSVSKQKEVGIGRTKKQAKQLAAYSMMNRLKESLADVLTELKEERHVSGLSPAVEEISAHVERSSLVVSSYLQVEPDNDNFEQAIAKYMATIGTPRRKFRLNRSPSKYENFFADVPQDFIDAAVKVLKEIPVPKNENERKELDVDWMLQLTRVMECLNASTMLMPGKHMKNGNKCLFLQINLSTEASFFGVGKSADEAIQDAAYSALVFINIQLRNVKKAHDLA
ncbi:hypothetical protein R5R35_010532 [Gryllus longicercus]|uniref:DRBM domain-containing protein n=1 Tax=Gryllus longicercus TaxID=2509291 RepID=A0AAN9YYC2_9ORTH